MSIDFRITSLSSCRDARQLACCSRWPRACRAGGGEHRSAFGCTLGIVPHMAAAIMGLCALLHTSALAFQIRKYLGVAYLLYMAWSTLQEHGACASRTRSRPVRPSVIVAAVLANILNPKLSIFFSPSCRSLSARTKRAPRADAGAERVVHADDLRRVRGLRRLHGRRNTSSRGREGAHLDRRTSRGRSRH